MTKKKNSVITTEPKEPVMSKKEMEKFISVIANTETLNGDYVHNGFLYFLSSIYETIKENPIEAQNLMFRLQQHIFNNKMWESFYAFEAHKKKAHLIFAQTEPYISFDEPEETGAVDSTSKTEKHADKPETENTALLISDLLNNPNVPEAIRDGLSEGIADCFNSDNEQTEIIDFQKTPEYIAMVLRGAYK